MRIRKRADTCLSAGKQAPVYLVTCLHGGSPSWSRQVDKLKVTSAISILPFYCQSIHKFIPFFFAFPRSFTSQCIHASVHSFDHLFIHPSSIHPSIHPYICLSSRLSKAWWCQQIMARIVFPVDTTLAILHPFTVHPSINLCIHHQSMHSFTNPSNVQCINAFIHLNSWISGMSWTVSCSLVFWLIIFHFVYQIFQFGDEIQVHLSTSRFKFIKVINYKW